MVQYWILDCNLPHLRNAIDLNKETFNSQTVPDCKVYYACFSPTTVKYPQPEKFSTYTLSISLSWKLQRFSPNTTLQIAVNEPQAHTSFLCFIFSLKEKFSQKKKQSERPILTALTQRLNSEIYLRCRLRHRQLLSSCNAPK